MLFNPEMSIVIQRRHLDTGDINSETSGDSKNVFLHCGHVLGLLQVKIWKQASGAPRMAAPAPSLFLPESMSEGAAAAAEEGWEEAAEEGWEEAAEEETEKEEGAAEEDSGGRGRRRQRRRSRN